MATRGPDLLTLNAIIHGDAGREDKDVAKKALAYLQEIGLMHATAFCECGRRMDIVDLASVSDHYCWRCPGMHCRKRRSVRHGSIFNNSKLTMGVLLHLFYLYSEDIPAYLASRMLRDHVSGKSVLEWYDLLRGYLSRRLMEQPIRFFGENVSLQVIQDAGSTVDCDVEEEGVEIDESWFGKKAKYHRGTSRQTTMVFGVVARSGTKCSLRIVPDAKKITLWPLIQQDIHTSCPIYSDGHATYQSLNTVGYTHHVVNHSEEFVTADGIHTNTMEGLWGLGKQRISRMHGLCSQNRLAAHLDEFSFRQSYAINGSIWNDLIQLCRAI